MAQGSVSWLSRLARHALPHKEALEAEKRRRLWSTRAEEVALSAGAEADAEAQRLRRELQQEILAGERRLEEARNYSAHLAQRLLFEQGRAEAWKAASFGWQQAAESSAGRSGWIPNLNQTPKGRVAKELQEKAERSERLQALPELPGNGVARDSNGRSR